MSEPVTSLAISKYIALAAWSVLGGITHALAEKRKGGVKNMLDGFILAVISGFCGLMWGLIALKLYPGDVLVMAFMSGLGGFMSLEGLALVVNYLKKKLLTNNQ
jgi:hypothetical protein